MEAGARGEKRRMSLAEGCAQSEGLILLSPFLVGKVCGFAARRASGLLLGAGGAAAAAPASAIAARNMRFCCNRCWYLRGHAATRAGRVEEKPPLFLPVRREQSGGGRRSALGAFGEFSEVLVLEDCEDERLILNEVLRRACGQERERRETSEDSTRDGGAKREGGGERVREGRGSPAG